jgi:UDP-N-acetylmuramate: L-alanyl-gamma-D-glutamyl-meso-diaminopimelate ligase
VPKFFFYKPYHTILTSLEFDHADIYNSIEEIEIWFKRLITMIPSDGTIVYNSRYDNLNAITNDALSHVYSYGKDHSDFNFHLDKYNSDISYLNIDSRESGVIDVESHLFGEFNFDNIAAAVTMAGLIGISYSDIIEAVKSFQGVKRRQDLIYNKENIKVYEDFAHHPTAVENILKTMAERFPNARIWALYEPRSATSRRNVFQRDIAKALSIADIIKVKEPFDLTKIPAEERIDMNSLINDVKLTQSIAKEINKNEENVFIIMSNGGFDDIYSKLPIELDKL